MSYKGTVPFDEQQDPEKLYPFSSCLAITTCLPKHRSWYPHEQLLHLTYGIHTLICMHITRPHHVSCIIIQTNHSTRLTIGIQ